MSLDFLHDLDDLDMDMCMIISVLCLGILLKTKLRLIDQINGLMVMITLLMIHNNARI